MEIKSYSKGELAQAYAPDITAHAAVNEHHSFTEIG